MKKLTDKQIISILRLGTNSPSVDYADVSFHNGGSEYVTVVSMIDSEMVDIMDRLTEIFGSITVDEEPFHVVIDNGTFNDLYTLKVGGEKIISLHMHSSQKKEAPLPEGATEEIIPSYDITTLPTDEEFKQGIWVKAGWNPTEILRQEA